MAYSETFLREFFELYREQESLWKVTSSLYHDKTARKNEMNLLVAKFREVKEDADENFVKKKINNYRTSYKRELKLVKNSLKSGAGADEVYKPKLWYFELLSFLGDQDLPRQTVSNMYNEEEVTDPENIQTDTFVLSPSNYASEESQVTETSSCSGIKTHSRYKRGRNSDPRDDLLITLNKRLSEQASANKEEKDRFSTYGENVAIKLRDLPKDQRIVAEKLINDVLFEAECNNLNRLWSVQPPSSSNAPVTQRPTTTYTNLQPPQHVSSYNYPSLSVAQLLNTFDANQNQ